MKKIEILGRVIAEIKALQKYSFPLVKNENLQVSFFFVGRFLQELHQKILK